MACDAQGVPSGGVRAPAECEEGMGWLEMTCSTCEPFLASSGVCLNACVRDSACFPGFHCAQDGCHPPSNGSPCEVDTECDSGRCEGSCEPRAPDGETCDEASDCAGGTCANGLCCAGGICCNAASSVEDCGAYTCNTSTFSCNTGCADSTNTSCATGFHCFSGNGQCVPNGDGSPCDEAADCISGYCNGAGVCAATFQIGRVGIGCNIGVGGGGGPFRVVRVLPTGTILETLSAASPGPLYATVAVSFDLTTNIQAGWHFALAGSEGSGPLLCGINVYQPGPAGPQIGTSTLLGMLPSDQFVRNQSGLTPDTFTLLFFDGAEVTASQVSLP